MTNDPQSEISAEASPLVYSNQFRDVERVRRRGKDLEKLKGLIRLLASGEPLPQSYRDHPLKGRFAGWRDAHLEPDWLLLYRATAGTVRLERTGSHADLFQ